MNPLTMAYDITWIASATDGTYIEANTSLLEITQSSVLSLGLLNKMLFNQKIANDIKAWVETLHGWTINAGAILIGGLFDLV